MSVEEWSEDLSYRAMKARRVIWLERRSALALVNVLADCEATGEAEISQAELGNRVGATADTVGSWLSTFEAVGVLDVTRPSDRPEGHNRYRLR